MLDLQPCQQRSHLKLKPFTCINTFDWSESFRVGSVNLCFQGVENDLRVATHHCMAERLSIVVCEFASAEYHGLQH